jgi:hypothetical protein
MGFPNFICIGAQKAGTTWIDAQLRQHPSVWMPPMKEVHFFDYLYREDFRKWITWHLNTTLKRELLKSVEAGKKKAMDWKRIKYLSELATNPKRFSVEWYKDIFAFAPKGAVCGEITPEYSTIGEAGISHMRELIPDVKIIYVIRDPISRAWSQLKMNMVRNGSLISGKVSDDAAFLENLNHPSIMDRGNYSSFVPQWDKYFTEGKDIMYIPFKDIQSSPQGLMQKIEEFLELSEYGKYEGLTKVVHKGSGMKRPDLVDDKLKQMMANEYEFLDARFGHEFSSRI